MRIQWLKALAVIAVAIVILQFEWGKGGTTNAKAQDPRPAAGLGAAPVVAEVAAQEDIDVTFSGLGTVTPLQSVSVRSQVSGQLLRVAYKEGQYVHAGDLLAEIDPRPFQVQLLQYEGQLQRDEALLNNAKVDLLRYERLLKEDSIAEQEVVTQRALVQQYAGALAVDRGQIASAKLQMQYARITSPLSGRVGLRLVDPGNYVQSGDASGLVVITQLQPITVVFTLPEDTLPEVLKRQGSNDRMTIEAYDRTGHRRLAKGSLLAIDNQIDPTTGTVKIKAQFENSDQTLYPNQFVNVKLIVETLHGVTTVPTAAIQRGIEGTFVYALKADQTVNLRTVQLGPTAGERIAVLQGVNPQERVVVDGADRLREGMKVEVVERNVKSTPAPTVASSLNSIR